VTRVADPRKNVRAGVDAFISACGKSDRARLIVKGWPSDPPNLHDDSRIIYLRENLTPTQLNALYELGDVYVSPHHSEGWGWPMADAMIFKKPVIATGYSGNIEFMSEENSFLVSFEEDYIRPQDCSEFFQSDMKWAYPDLADLEAKYNLLYKNLNEEWVRKKVERGFDDIKRFNQTATTGLIKKRLDLLKMSL
jgi:glycosyltransferase involved in cell wall biosynthesis